MKLSFDWLKEFVDMTESAEEISEILTMHIAEVDVVTHQADAFSHVVVGEVLSTNKHPDADQLNVGIFDVGEVKPRQIVFGGKAVLNMGDKIPIALPGAKVGELAIEKRKLRGQVSEGMCCLNSELGILNNAEEINLFDKNVKNGSLVSEILELDDTIFEIDNKTLTHRADLFNHIGFARELATVLGRSLNVPEIERGQMKSAGQLNISVENLELCPRYVGAILENIEVKASPDWMQRRLSSLGVNVINNVVDITNYVMLEQGQPLHAFDFNKLGGGKINVRTAQQGESLTTLDGFKRNLSNEILVISDSQGPVAIAGVIGGIGSEVDSNTKSIVLESAQFNGTAVRVGAQKLGLRTDGSTRHEKGLGFSFSENGFWRAVSLLEEYAGAKLIHPVTDTAKNVPQKDTIILSMDYLNRLIGVAVEKSQVIKWLSDLGCDIKEINDSTLSVQPDLTRTDLKSQPDLVEEVARMYGYDAIKEQPLLGSLEPPQHQSDFKLGDNIISLLTGWGANEVYNYSFYSEADAIRAELDCQEHVAVLNPMNPNQKLLRQTLLVNLLNNVKKNLNNGFSEFILVEYGHLYYPENEFAVVGGIITSKEDDVFYKAKGYVDAVLSSGHVNSSFETITKDQELENHAYAMFEPVADARYLVDNKQIATVGKVRHAITEKFGIDNNIAYFTLKLDILANFFPGIYSEKLISVYPAIDLDISIEVERSVPWKEIKETINKSAGKILQSAEVFDVYQGEKVAGDRKALGIRLWFQSMDRTLEMPEAEKIRAKIIKALAHNFNAEHRF